MYSEAISLIERAISTYSSKMDKEEIELLIEAEMECRNNILSKIILRKLVRKAQRVIFKYSKDHEDLEELIGY